MTFASTGGRILRPPFFVSFYANPKPNQQPTDARFARILSATASR